MNYLRIEDFYLLIPKKIKWSSLNFLNISMKDMGSTKLLFFFFAHFWALLFYVRNIVIILFNFIPICIITDFIWHKFKILHFYLYIKTVELIGWFWLYKLNIKEIHLMFRDSVSKFVEYFQFIHVCFFIFFMWNSIVS